MYHHSIIKMQRKLFRIKRTLKVEIQIYPNKEVNLNPDILKNKIYNPPINQRKPKALEIN